jgi:hypothetical protein
MAGQRITRPIPTAKQKLENFFVMVLTKGRALDKLNVTFGTYSFPE